MNARRLLIVLMAALAASWYALPAAAIQDGTIDTKPYRYPNVLCLWTGTPESDFTEYTCATGTLIGRRVVLTAGHATIWNEFEGVPFYVSTDATVPLDPDTSSMIRVKRAVTHPEFLTSDGWKHDIGVMILERPITGVPLAELPTEGLLDELQAQYGSVDKIPGGFTVAGYGVQRDEGGNWIFDAPRVRRHGPAYIDGLPDKWFNWNSKKSAVTPGDSGAPVFLGTSFTLAGVVGGWTRLDTPSARDFLDDFVPVP